MRRFITFIFTLAILLSTSSVTAFADKLWLKNGDLISGTLVRLENDRLIFNTGYAGEIAVKREEVANLQTDALVTVHMGSDTVIQGIISPSENGRVTIRSADVRDPFWVELAQLKAINPKPPEPALKTNVRVNFGASFTDGNTETESIYGDGELVARTAKNRFTLGAIFKRSESNDVTTADSVIGFMKYDYFLSQKWFVYANATGEKDEFKDLDLRTSAGVGSGYQFLETEMTNLSLEAGVSYVNEDHITAEDTEYTAGRWGLRFEHFFLKKALQFFHFNTGLQSFEDSDDLVIYTQTGFRLPLYKNLNATFQFNYDYDNSPSPGRETADTAVIVSLGDQWSG